MIVIITCFGHAILKQCMGYLAGESPLVPRLPPRRILWNTFGVGPKGSLKNKFSTREQLRNLNLFAGARLSAHFLQYKSSPQGLKHMYLSSANML